jgi:hypothetical protein
MRPSSAICCSIVSSTWLSFLRGVSLVPMRARLPGSIKSRSAAPRIAQWEVAGGENARDGLEILGWDRQEGSPRCGLDHGESPPHGLAVRSRRFAGDANDLASTLQTKKRPREQWAPETKNAPSRPASHLCGRRTPNAETAQMVCIPWMLGGTSAIRQCPAQLDRARR